MGLICIECPVHASNACRWATIQSTEPSSCTTANDVVGDRTESNTVTGLVDDIYTNVRYFQSSVAVAWRLLTF